MFVDFTPFILFIAYCVHFPVWILFYGGIKSVMRKEQGPVYLSSATL